MQDNIVIVAAVRTAVGKAGKGFLDFFCGLEA